MVVILPNDVYDKIKWNKIAIDLAQHYIELEKYFIHETPI